MQLLLPPVSRKTHSEFTKVISSPVKLAANLKTLLRTLDKVMNEPRQRAKGQDCARAECCFNEEGSSDSPLKFADVYQSSDEDRASSSSSSTGAWIFSVLSLQTGFTGRKKAVEEFLSESLKKFNNGGSPQQRPSEGGREGGAAAASLGLQRNTSGSCIAAQITRTCLMADHRHTHAVWGSSTLGFPCRLMYLMYIWLF